MKHPKLILCEQLKERANKLYEEVREEGKEVAKQFKKKYQYTTIDTERNGIRINATLLNPELWDNHIKVYGVVNNRPETNIRSVEYYRINNVLKHTGGGWLILNEDEICSDEDWEQIKTGNIPEKFLR